jgi:hypothetical protein
MRKLEPKRLTNLVSGDLDWIVMKCLEKERSRRYDTANGLAQDIQRYLSDEPISARRPSAGYRLRRFVRRNREPAIAAVLVLIVLLVGIVGTTWGLFEAKSEQRRADEEARNAREQERIANARATEAENARLAEAERVKERDAAIEREKDRVKERDKAVKDADNRADDLKYQLGVSNMILASNAYDNRDVRLAIERLDSVPPEQRGWEWHYLKRQSRGGLFTLYGHTQPVTSVTFSPDGMRFATSSLDQTAMVWDARTGKPQVELKGHTRGVRSVSFSPDGTRIVTGSDDLTAKVWDARTGTPHFELKGHAGVVWSVSFSPDGTRIVTGSDDLTAKVWDARISKLDLGDKSRDAEEFSYRLIHTRTNFWRYQEGYDVARQASDRFAALFYLDRLLSMPNQRTTERFHERNDFQADPRLIARTSFHQPDLAKTPYDRTVFQTLAINGDRLAKRLVAQESLREGKPKPAVPLFFECMLSRPITSPPVEELLLAQAYLDLNQPDEAKRFFRTATEWLDRPCKPIRAMNIVSHCALNPWAGLGEAFAPVDDPRRNPFDWETWYESDVFRAAVARRLARDP